MQCDIVSAQELIFTGDATMVVASGTTGELGIAPARRADTPNQECGRNIVAELHQQRLQV